MRVFVEEIAQIVEDNTSLVLGSNLMVGELPMQTEGVFLVTNSLIEPDRYLPTFNETIDFWAVYKKSDVGYALLKFLYLYFHRKEHYTTDSYHVYYSNALGQVQDFDRDSEGRKMWRVTIDFTCLQLIS